MIYFFLKTFITNILLNAQQFIINVRQVCDDNQADTLQLFISGAITLRL